MRPQDFDFAVRLTDLKRWEYSRRDFACMTSLEPHGCFVAVENGRRVGITTTINYRSLGWIGNVIVSPRYEGKGIGSQLVNHAIDYLKGKSVNSIGLYSYPDSTRLYGRMGFQEDGYFIRLSGKGKPAASEECQLMKRRHLGDVTRLDSQCIGADRRKVLTKIFEEFGNLCWVAISSEKLAGYIMGTSSRTSVELGPWICDPRYADGAFTLLSAFLSSTRNKKINLGIPERHVALRRLQESGFKPDFRVARMFHKGKKPSMKDDYIIAMESLERG